MEDINCWQSKYQSCEYSDRLMDKLYQINQEVNRPIDLEEVRKGIYYAKKYHGSQMRQSGEPYYSHPIEVAYMVSDYLYRTDIIVTSILHDTIEDTPLTEKMIAYIFGEQVASQVEDLSRNKPHGKISSAKTLALLFQQKKHDVALIKIVDRIHNLETVGIKSPKKIKKIVEETFKSFLSVSACCGATQLENILTALCYKHLPITECLLDTTTITRHKNQLLALVFENDINQK